MSKLYKIAICDDEVLWQTGIKDIIEQYFFTSLNNARVDLFESAQSFLNSKIDYDFLFLDIEMPKMNGIELKNSLWIKNSKLGIIFITSYKEHMVDAFGKNVLSFICKEELYKIPSILEKIEKEDSMFTVIKHAGNMIDTRDIMYFKAEGNYTNAIMKTGISILFSRSITQLLDELHKEIFVRVHRSYVVNVAYVKCYSYKDVTLMNNDTISLSRKYITIFKLVYYNYLKER